MSAGAQAIAVMIASELNDVLSQGQTLANWLATGRAERLAASIAEGMNAQAAADPTGAIREAVANLEKRATEIGDAEAVRVRLSHALYGEGNDPGHPLAEVADALIALARSAIAKRHCETCQEAGNG